MIDLEVLNKNMKIKRIKLLENIEGKNITISTKMTFIDEEGFKYYLTQQNIISSIRKNGVLARYFQKNPYTYENINNYLKLNDIPLKLLTKNPTTAICKLEWECLIHNNIFNRSWNVIKNGSVFCDICNKEHSRELRVHTIDFVRKEWLKLWNVTLISKKYISNDSKLQYICNIHKDKGTQETTWANSLGATHICKHCLKEIMKEKTRKSHEQFEKELKDIHGDKYKLLSKYDGSINKVLVHCNKCGEDFETKAGHLLEGHGCPNCNKSKGEEKVKVYFDSNNINYKREYRFDDCIGINKKLPFDYYLKEYNLCIEYQGQQHYEPVELFGGQKQFKIQQINDNLKRKYCKENNINLLEIPYWDYNNVDVILQNKLKQLRKDAIQYGKKNI